MRGCATNGRGAHGGGMGSSGRAGGGVARQHVRLLRLEVAQHGELCFGRYEARAAREVPRGLRAFEAEVGAVVAAAVRDEVVPPVEEDAGVVRREQPVLDGHGVVGPRADRDVVPLPVGWSQ